jgi:hypothetical protein
MKKSKQGNKARILPLKKQREFEVDHDEVTAVTRSLFTETWNSYVDQVYTAAVKLEHSAKKAIKPSPSKKNEQSVLRIVH